MAPSESAAPASAAWGGWSLQWALPIQALGQTPPPGMAGLTDTFLKKRLYQSNGLAFPTLCYKKTVASLLGRLSCPQMLWLSLSLGSLAAMS